MTIIINLSTGSMKVNDFHWVVHKGELHVVSYDTNIWKITGSGSVFDGMTKDYPLGPRPPGVTDSFMVSMIPDSSGEFEMTYVITFNGAPINSGTIGFKKSSKNDDFPFTYTATYGDCGTYELTYYATDDDGGIHEDTCIVTVANSDPLITPFGPFNGKPDVPIEFSAQVTDQGSDDLTFIWDFGDNTPLVTNVYLNNETEPDPPEGSINGTFPFSITDTVTHTYSTKDKFSLKLTVEDDNGGISTYTTTVSTPRNRNIYRHNFVYFIEKIIKNFPVFKQILGL